MTCPGFNAEEEQKEALFSKSRALYAVKAIKIMRAVSITCPSFDVSFF